MPDYSMVPDLFFPVCCGEKGNLKARIQCKESLSQIVRLKSGTADNVIPARAEADILAHNGIAEQAAKLAEGREDIEVSASENLVTVIAKGTGGHSAMPEGKINAIWVLTKFLGQLDGLDEQDRNICSALARFSGDYDGTALGIASSDAPSGKLVCSAVRLDMDGHIPEVMFSSRYPVTDYREHIESALLQTITAEGFEIKEVVNSDPMYIPEDDPYVQCLMNVYKEATGKERKPYVIDGGTYARKLKNAVGYGGGNGVRADFLPEGHGAVHQPDEARNIDGILEAIKIYVLSVIEIDQMIQRQKKAEV